MTFKITDDSHLDHGLSSSAIEFLRDRFADKDGAFISTVHLPDEMLDCALHGPIMGDEPVPSTECTFEVRGNRKGASRLCSRPSRKTPMVTVIAGPAGDEPCVLYTAYGGPCAPREPWDESMTEAERKESQRFWALHALTRPATLVNLTPHALKLSNEGEEWTIEPSGSVARLAATPGDLRRLEGVPVPVAQPDEYGQVEGLPEPKAGVWYVVSGLVGAHVHRPDVLMPGTGPKDEPIREAGQIVAVTRLKSTAST